MKRVGLTALLVAVMASTAHAGGRPPGRTQPDDIETRIETDSYRSETVIADVLVLGLGLMASGIAAENTNGDDNTAIWTMLGLTGAGYALTVPAIHWRHDQKAEAGASLGMRVLLPTVAGYALHEWEDCDAGEECDGIGAGLGVFFGMVTAMVLDHALLPKKQVERTYIYRYALSPSVQLTDDRVSLSLGGSF